MVRTHSGPHFSVVFSNDVTQHDGKSPTLIAGQRKKERFFVRSNIYTGCFTTLGTTAGSDFLGLCDQKFHINMCPILDGYGVMGVF